MVRVQAPVSGSQNLIVWSYPLVAKTTLFATETGDKSTAGAAADDTFRSSACSAIGQRRNAAAGFIKLQNIQKFG